MLSGISLKSLQKQFIILKMLNKYFDRVKNNFKNVLIKADNICCCVCLESTRNSFVLLDFTFSYEEVNLSCAKEMMRAILNEKDLNNLLTKYICDICEQSLKQAFSFIDGVRNNSKIMDSYLEQLNKQIDAVFDQLESTSNIANTVLVVQNYIEEPEPKATAEVADNISDNDAYDEGKVDDELSDPNILLCNICGKSFQCKSAIIYHMKNMHREKKRKSKHDKKRKACPECTEYPCVHEKYLVAAFGKRLKGLHRYQCKDCDHTFRSKMYLISHVNSIHLNHAPYLCDICGSSFPSSFGHRQHIKQRHSDRGICEYCDSLVKNVQLHIESCRTIQRPHKCISCPASFDNIEKLKRHDIKSHTKKHQCRICWMTFCHSTGLSNHEKGVHGYSPMPKKIKNVSKPKTLKDCDLCPMQFTSSRGLGYHLESVHKNEKYKCNICNKEYETRKKYLSHTRSSYHLKRENPNIDLNSKCDYCSFSCGSKIVLENHINVLHRKIKPYLCESCPKAFTTQFHLKNHMDRHTGIRNYKCDVCGAAFENLSGLRRHVYRRHEKKENWPFSCEVCGKRFVSSTEKNFHEKRAHFSERTLQCPLCESLFTMTSHVRLHITRVHAKGKSHEMAEFLKANKHNKELIELFRDRRKPHVEDSPNFSLTVA